MKLFALNPCLSAAPRREGGFVVIALMMLIAIMLVLVAANGRSLVTLKKELKLIERRQMQRLNATNAVPVLLPPPNAVVHSP